MKNFIKVKGTRKALMLTLFTTLFFTITSVGQQLPVLTFGFETPIIYNPASSPFKNSRDISLQYRQQWVGIPGAPETIILSTNAKPAENMGLGLFAFSDQTNILGQVGLAGNYGYRIKFSENYALSLGLSASLINNQIHFDKIKATATDEPIIFSSTQKATNFDIGFGVRYSFKNNLFLDLSAINLLQNQFSYEDQASFKGANIQLMTHYYISMGYKYLLENGKYQIEPWVSIRSVQGTPAQYEANISFDWNETVKFTSGYRQADGLFAALQVRVFESITLGYAHDFANRNIKGVSNGSNELFLSFKISKATPSFKEKSATDDIRIIKKQSQEQYQEIERLQQENERLVKQQALNDSLVKNQKVEIDKLKEVFLKDKDAVDRIKEKYIVRETEVDSLVSVSKMNNEESKRIYVIVGAYLTLADAKLFQKILEREIGLQTLIFEREDGRYYFVYTRQVKSSDEVKKEFKRLKRLNIDSYINGNLWLYGEH